MLRRVSDEHLWIPLVDEPIGTIVSEIQLEDDEIDRLVDSPSRLLAFKTFAYIRVGILLGQLLVEQDVEPYDGSSTWVELLMRDESHSAAIRRELRAVAEEIDADPRYAEEPAVGPDPATRARFREFAQRRLANG
jgi:hypothetical protein